MYKKIEGDFMRVSPIMAGISFKGTTRTDRRSLNAHRMIPLTGYIAMGGGFVAGVSGFRHNRIVHKVAAAVALVAAMAHILLLKTMHGVGHNNHRHA